MEYKIENLRSRIQDYYDELIRGRDILAPKVFASEIIGQPGGEDEEELAFFDRLGLVLVVNNINLISNKFRGYSYLAGRVVERKKLSESHRGILVKEDDLGIRPFEEYSNEELRPVFEIPDGSGLVINLSSLERNKDSFLMRGRSVKEVVRVNLDYYSILVERARTLGETAYMRYYLGVLAKEPLFY